MKNICSEYSHLIKKLEISEHHWEEIAKLVEVLEPIHEANLKLQHAQLILSDFYNIIIECKLKIQKINSTYSKVLENSIDERFSKILNSDTMLSCIYLDPRYQILLNSKQKEIAKEHIFKIYNYIEKLNETSSELDNSVSLVSETQNEELDEIDKLIFAKEKELKEPTFSNNRDFKQLINDYDNIQRIARKDDPKMYWQINNNNKFKELSKVANILFAVPATQVSVERAFSTGKDLTQKR